MTNEENNVLVVAEADQWLEGNRISETWRTVNRLRDALTRTTDQLGRQKALLERVSEYVAAVREELEASGVSETDDLYRDGGWSMQELGELKGRLEMCQTLEEILNDTYTRGAKMNSFERLNQMKSRVEGTPEGPWETGWDGQEFYVAPVSVRDNPDHVYLRLAEWTFAIHPGNSIEMNECDTGVGEFLAYARTDLPLVVDLLRDVLKACNRIEDSIVPDDEFEKGQKTVVQALRMMITSRLEKGTTLGDQKRALE